MDYKQLQPWEVRGQLWGLQLNATSSFVTTTRHKGCPGTLSQSLLDPCSSTSPSFAFGKSMSPDTRQENGHWTKQILWVTLYLHILCLCSSYQQLYYWYSIPKLCWKYENFNETWITSQKQKGMHNSNFVLIKFKWWINSSAGTTIQRPLRWSMWWSFSSLSSWL